MSAGTAWKQLGALGRDIKLAHTVFALPFAVLAMVLAAAWAGRRPSVDRIRADRGVHGGGADACDDGQSSG